MARAAEPAPAQAAAQGDCTLEPIHFAFDRSTLSADAREALDRLAACLAERSLSVRVVGHCDPRGRLEYNRWLAWDRAAAVAGYLREHGVAHGRVSTHFADATDCPEATEACFAGQRRVEVLLREPPAPADR